MNIQLKRIALLLLACLSFLMTGCITNPTRKAPPPAGSWLVLLCKASDAPDEPHPVSYYEEIFSRNNRVLLFDYFDIESNHKVDVSGTEVYGWFSMSVKTADIAPSVRNNNTPVTRTQTARDCKASALGAILATGVSVDPANYAGVITVINVPVDVGATGEKSVVTSYHAESEIGFFSHEMLHVLGLPDSWSASADASADHVWNHGGDAMYGDCWDAMSFRTCDSHYLVTSRGPQSPELQGAFRERLGWLPTDRIQLIPGYTSQTKTIALAPINNSSKLGIQLVDIEVPNQGYYVVEYHQRFGFDRSMLFLDEAVVIRESRNNRTTYLVLRQDGTGAWRAGDVFTDKGNYLSIAVDNISLGNATITINTAYSPNILHVGDQCGDRYRGEVLACPNGTQCKSKRLGSQLETVDWYCQ